MVHIRTNMLAIWRSFRLTGSVLAAMCLWWPIICLISIITSIRYIVNFFCIKTIVPCTKVLELASWLSSGTRRNRIIPARNSTDNYLVRHYPLLQDRTRFPFNIFFHKFLQGDDDDDIHDHPWGFFHVIISGGYWEHVLEDSCNPDNTRVIKVWRPPGYFNYADASYRHRIELEPGVYPWTLFIPFGRLQEWGFWKPTTAVSTIGYKTEGSWYKIYHEEYLREGSKNRITTSQISRVPIRVMTYNVLSECLSGCHRFPECNPHDLDPNVRFNRILCKIKTELANGTIIALQEVSRDWGARLIPILEEFRYTHAVAFSGHPRNGYMGQLLAWPTDTYKSLEVKTVRLADTSDGWEQPPTDTAPLFNWWEGLIDKTSGRPPFDAWRVAQDRYNCLVAARLRSKNGENFVISTYHVPCLFGDNQKCQVVSIHISLLFRYMQKFAGDDPLIVAGDFNIKPSSVQYKLITEGSVPEGHVQIPSGGHVPMEFSPMRSAYKIATGSEPDFTNLALVVPENTQPYRFVDTLDYIWLSESWGVTRISELPSYGEVQGIQSLPTAHEPSDHIALVADLIF